MKKRQITILAITLSIILVGYLTMLFLVSQKSLPKRQEPIAAERYVKAEKLEYKSIISPVLATGRMSSSQVIDLVSEASGKIEEGNVLFKKGQSFKKGDVLVKIYDDEAKLSLKAKKSKFMNSLALLLPDIKIDFPDSYKHFKNFFITIDLDNDLPSLPKITSDKMKIYLASRNLLNDYYVIKGEELRIKRYVIRAPFDGALMSVNSEVGSFVGMGAKLAKIINTNNLELEVPVRDVKSKWIGVGDRVKISMNGDPTVLKGIVLRKSNFIDVNTQSRGIYVKITSGIDNIVWGHYMKAEFEGMAIEAAMEIPRSAVFNYNHVYVIKDNMLYKRKINIIKQNAVSIVFDGLEGDLFIVTEPLIDARENTKVKILK